MKNRRSSGPSSRTSHKTNPPIRLWSRRSRRVVQAGTDEVPDRSILNDRGGTNAEPND
jgi:hypothetical protein